QSPLKDHRRQLLRSIDLLVIDEVSMLRADLLDAIDYRLKSARGNFNQPFGGIQMLFIGDLFQLPPVTRRDEEAKLRQYYASPWFFDAQCLRSDALVYIELDKIFRQRDATFISILNNLRNNLVTPEDIATLNEHYRPDLSLEEMRNSITLTTHNQQADDINIRALAELNKPAQEFTARIEGDFPESMYPALPQLTLKTGAQVMFIRNDTEGKLYVNGKIGVITSMEDDEITVRLSDSGDELPVKRTVWENKSFRVNKDTQDIEEDIAGTFEQFPLKLAWAITIHKSQGLTFDRAIIDPGRAFTDGQVYVALSRLRTLDGLLLRSRINPSSISTDRTVVTFTSARHDPDALPATAARRQREFIGEVIVRTFEFEPILREIENREKKQPETLNEDATFQRFTTQLASRFLSERSNTDILRQQLLNLLEAGNIPYMMERVEKGSAYYLNLLWQSTEGLLNEIRRASGLKRAKGYLTLLADLDQLVSLKIVETERARTLIGGILSGESRFNFSEDDRQRTLKRAALHARAATAVTAPAKKPKKERKEKVKEKKVKPVEGANRLSETVELSLGLFTAGMTVDQIASERNLVSSTIFMHLAKAVDAGRLSITDLVPEESLKELVEGINRLPEGTTLTDLFSHFDGRHPYGYIKVAVNHVNVLKNQ
ncbi:MAG: helix-turn-helix domain-containing protein, partial [Bacteroidota bacterium]